MFQKTTKLRNTLISLGLVQMLALSFVFMVMVYTSVKQSLIDQTRNYLSSYSEIARWQILQTVNDGKKQIQALSESPIIIDRTQTAISEQERDFLRQYLLDQKSTSDIFIDLFLVDSEGIVQVSTNPSQEFTSKNKRAYFLGAQTDLYIQSVYHNLRLQQSIMTFATPLKDSNGETYFILVGHLNTSRWNLFLSSSMGLGDTGVAYLVNTYNYFATSPGAKPGYAFERANFSSGVVDCLKGTNQVISTMDFKQSEVLGSYFWMDELKLCLVTEIEEKEILDPISLLVPRIFFTLMAVMILGGAYILRSSSNITKPIETLTEGIIRLTTGDLDHRVSIPGKNEISYLAIKLNQMADQLNQTIARLSESEAKYRGIFENVQDVFYQADGQGNLTEISPSVERYLNITKSSLLGKKVEVFYHDKTDYTALMTAMEHTGQVEDFEIRIKGGGGKELYASVNAQYVFNEQGKLIRTEGVLRDITDRKRIQILLQEKEERLELALQGTQAGLWDWQLQTGELILNERWAEIIGYTLDELQPISIQTWLDLTHPKDLEQANRLLQEHSNGKTDIYSCKFRMKHKNGYWTWIISRGKVVLYDADGKPIRAVGTHMDINEQALAQYAQKESEAHFRSLFESSADGIAVVYQNGIILRINPALSAITGYSRDDLVGFPDDRLFKRITGDDTSGQHITDIRQALQENGIWRKEIQAKRPSGEVYDADIVVTTSQYSPGSKPDLIVSIRDITQLRALDRMQSRFISTVSHELRTPLSIIILFIENLIEYYDQLDEEQRQDILKDIHEEAQSLGLLIEDVLLLSRIDANHSSNHISRFDLSTLSHEICSELESTARKKNIIIQEEYSLNSPLITGSRDQLRQVFRNLLTNAIKFSPVNKPIILRLQQQNQSLVVEVSDSGIGIAPEDIDKIFERFYRCKSAETNEIPGTGLGLAIAKEIVENHQGSISVYSELNKGSTFQVFLPVTSTEQSSSTEMETHD